MLVAQQQHANPLDYFVAPRIAEVPICAPPQQDILGADQENQQENNNNFAPIATAVPTVLTGGGVKIEFYSKRQDAMASRGMWAAESYCNRNNSSINSNTISNSRPAHQTPYEKFLAAPRGFEDVVCVAMDFRTGSGAKQFAVMPGRRVFRFLHDLEPTRRNLYMVVNPDHPLDIFFDLDGAFQSEEEMLWWAAAHIDNSNNQNQDQQQQQQRRATSSLSFRLACDNVAVAVVKGLVSAILEKLNGSNGTSNSNSNVTAEIERVAVFDSCNTSTGKISFHVHIRLWDSRAQRPLVFRSMSVLAAFVKAVLFDIKNGLLLGGQQQNQEEGEDAEKQQQEQQTSKTTTSPSSEKWLRFVDTAVYTAWRAFRLPFCAKRGPVFNGQPLLPRGPATSAAAAADLLTRALPLSVLLAELNAHHTRNGTNFIVTPDQALSCSQQSRQSRQQQLQGGNQEQAEQEMAALRRLDFFQRVQLDAPQVSHFNSNSNSNNSDDAADDEASSLAAPARMLIRLVQSTAEAAVEQLQRARVRNNVQNERSNQQQQQDDDAHDDAIIADDFTAITPPFFDDADSLGHTWASLHMSLIARPEFCIRVGVAPLPVSYITLDTFAGGVRRGRGGAAGADEGIDPLQLMQQQQQGAAAATAININTAENQQQQHQQQQQWIAPLKELPNGSRVKVAETSRAYTLILAIFKAVLHPHSSAANLTRLTRLEYCDNGFVRGYYAYQKQSHYCPRLGREHKSSYVQLYITFGSIKVRCYSDDCAHEQCHTVRWIGNSSSDSAPGDQQQQQPAAVLPEHEALRASVRDIILPDMGSDVVSRRYAPRGQQHLQQQHSNNSDDAQQTGGREDGSLSESDESNSNSGFAQQQQQLESGASMNDLLVELL